MCTDSHYDIGIQRQIELAAELPEARIRQAVAWLLKKHSVLPGTGISIVITSDETVRQMNLQYRAVDAPTDVLSFPTDPSPVPDEETYLGDLVLALPTIERQAQAEQHTLSDELVLVVIHGTLHLLGYDHDTAEHQASMWAVQAQALSVMGVDIEVPLFEFPDDSSDAVSRPNSDSGM